MRPSLRHAVLCACFALVAGCGDSDKSKSGLDKLGGDLKGAGDKLADQAKEAGAAASKQMSETASSLDKLAADATSSLSMKGDELAKMLKSKLPDLEKTVDSVKAQLAAKGGALKDMVAGLTTKNETLTKALAALEKGGAAAGADLKKAAVDAFTALGTELKAAMAKLGG